MFPLVIIIIFFNYFLPPFILASFSFFASSSSTGPSIWPFCIAKKTQRLRYYYCAHVKDYDTLRSPSITMDTRVWNWMPSSLWFGSVFLLFLLLLHVSFSDFSFHTAPALFYIRVPPPLSIYFSGPAHNCFIISPIESIRFTLLANMLFDRATQIV